MIKLVILNKTNYTILELNTTKKWEHHYAKAFHPSIYIIILILSILFTVFFIIFIIINYELINFIPLLKLPYLIVKKET